MQGDQVGRPCVILIDPDLGAHYESELSVRRLYPHLAGAIRFYVAAGHKTQIIGTAGPFVARTAAQSQSLIATPEPIVRRLGQMGFKYFL
jgi:hypothetical protein